jgi:hypothetical protein
MSVIDHHGENLYIDIVIGALMIAKLSVPLVRMIFCK